MGKRNRDQTQAVHRYEVPFAVQALPFANPELGIGRLQTRPDPHSYAANITLVDAPDHRLIRAGVQLAHRIIGGVGEWYLSAPAWQPYLPAERIEPMGPDDLPEDYGDLILPFRRRATLGPVAAITYKRVEYIVNSTDDRPLALLRDERATIRRGGLTTGRFRQGTLTPLEATPEQLAAIDEALQVVGASRVPSFPSLAQRLGAPATGLSDFPAPRELTADATLEAFVGALMGWHLHTIMLADVAVRAGMARIEVVNAALREAADDIRGLAPCLDQLWSNEVLADIEWVISRPDDMPVSVRLGERYLGIIDRLVRAARAPRVGGLALHAAGSVLADASAQECAAMITAADAIRPGDDDESWAALERRLEAARATVAVAEHLFGKKARREAKRLRALQRRVALAATTPAEPSADELAELTPVEAFAAGGEFERLRASVRDARAAFCRTWPEQRRKLRAGQVRA